MKPILQNSVFIRALYRLQEWYRMGAIARFFSIMRGAYQHSRFGQWWERVCNVSEACPAESRYMQLILFLRRLITRLVEIARQGFLYRICRAIGRGIALCINNSRFGKWFHRLGVRGFLLAILALYLPIDYFIRAVAPSFIASVWDECFMLAATGYLLWHIGSQKKPLPSRAATMDGYLILFIAVGFFLMCAVSPMMNIAIAGYRAVTQYLFWFFLVTRLIEDDRDFIIFYGALALMAIMIALHGIYQFIVAAPIPVTWMSQSEETVRTRVYSLTGSPNVMGSFLVMFAPMVAGIAYYSKKLWVKIVAVGATGMMCLSCLFTFSKGAWAGLAVAVVVFAILLDRRLIALMGVAGAAAFLMVPSVANRILFVLTPEYKAASLRAGRMIRWQTGIALLHNQSNPLLGFGLGRFGGAVAMQNQVSASFEYFYMDNYYLKTLVEMGYIGLAFYIFLLAALIIWCLRSIRNAPKIGDSRNRILAASMFSGMMGVLTHCYFENIFEVPYMTAYFWSLAAAVMYLGYFRRPRPT